jgi:hypothetical protein
MVHVAVCTVKGRVSCQQEGRGGGKSQRLLWLVAVAGFGLLLWWVLRFCCMLHRGILPDKGMSPSDSQGDLRCSMGRPCGLRNMTRL